MCVCVCECVTLDLIRPKQSVKKLQRARLCAGHVINFLFLVFETSVLFVIARKNAIYLFVSYRLIIDVLSWDRNQVLQCIFSITGLTDP